ncbi:MAG: TIGR03000 domain-containing protein [Planctomycetia bacterium]|nr:TIGR03000 domain-containing protein [Planctomycetia bacterium]
MNKKCFVVAAVFTLLLAGFSQSASAWWGHRYPAVWGGPYYAPAYYGWSYPVYGWGYDACCAPAVADPCCATVCDPCGPVVSTGAVLGWRPGPVRRLLFGRYRWYSTGYWGGYAYASYPGYYSACCDDFGGGTIIEDSAPSSTVTPAPAADPKPSIVDQPTNSVTTYGPVYHRVGYAPAESKETPVPENSGIVTVYVPIDAVVYVNDLKTTTEGSKRSFVSFGLEEGNEYDYVVRAEVTRNGQTHVETRLVTLQAGKNESISFAFSGLTPIPGEEIAALK